MTTTAEIVDLPNERVTYDDKGHLDEVVTHGGAHLEHLGGKNWFLSCQRADGTTVDLWFEGKINDMEDDGDPGLWFKTHRRVCRSCEGIGHVPVEAADHIETLARERDRAVEGLKKAREHACAAVCKRCAAGNVPFWLHGADAYVHDMALSVKEGMQDCDATAIRRTLADIDTESEGER